jgi:hypothetical protein
LLRGSRLRSCGDFGPPEYLTEEQKEEFSRVVTLMPGGMVHASEHGGISPILSARLAWQTSELTVSTPCGVKTPAELETLMKRQEVETRCIAKLMTRLRMSPQSVAPKTVSQAKIILGRN